eukprot:gene717-2511_t
MEMGWIHRTPDYNRLHMGIQQLLLGAGTGVPVCQTLVFLELNALSDFLLVLITFHSWQFHALSL